MDSLIAFTTENEIHLKISTATNRSIILLGETPKLLKITDFIQICFIGSNSIITRFPPFIKENIILYNRKMNIFNKEMSVSEVANFVRNIVYQNIRKMKIDIQFVVFETNSKECNTDLYLIDMYGCLSKSKTIALGLASYFCYGVFDSEYRYNLNKEEGKELINKCSKAINRSVLNMRDKCYVINKKTGRIEEY